MPDQLNEANNYILKAIHKWVWAGFYSPEEVDGMLDDILEENADETMLRAAVQSEFAKKQEAERGWPEITDNDRLESVFAALDKRGILCLHNAGYEMSDGHVEASEALSTTPKNHYFGYCFYHDQEVGRAVLGRGLMLAFDRVGEDFPDKLKVGQALKEELERAGFAVEWDGTTDQRIKLPKFDWKRRHDL